jgi:uncharacterized protein (TIGR02186 family)
MRAFALALGLILGCAPALAQTPRPPPPRPNDCLASGLAEDRVEVKVNYSGANVILFASSSATADPQVGFAVAVIGPGTRPTVIRRTPEGRKTFTFATAPSVFAIGAEPMVGETVSPEVLAAAGLNAAQAAVPMQDDLRNPDLALWRAALVDLKMEQRLYSVSDTRIERLDGGLRRARITLPPNAPPGEYKVRSAMFRDGRILCQSERPLILARGGMEETLFTLSRQHGLIYGIVAVSLGAIVGLFAAWVGRR